jgi:hypothetical protein
MQRGRGREREIRPEITTTQNGILDGRGRATKQIIRQYDRNQRDRNARE